MGAHAALQEKGAPICPPLPPKSCLFCPGCLSCPLELKSPLSPPPSPTQSSPPLSSPPEGLPNSPGLPGTGASWFKAIGSSASQPAPPSLLGSSNSPAFCPLHPSGLSQLLMAFPPSFFFPVLPGSYAVIYFFFFFFVLSLSSCGDNLGILVGCKFSNFPNKAFCKIPESPGSALTEPTCEKERQWAARGEKEDGG